MPQSDAKMQRQQRRLDELEQLLTGALTDLVEGHRWQEMLRFAIRFRSRSVLNAVLIAVQHEAAYRAGKVSAPLPSYVAGFRQWQSLGRAPERGQKGYLIRSPVTALAASATPQVAASWRRLRGGEAPRPGETVRRVMLNVRQAQVWDVSQTAGRPIPEPVRPTRLEGPAPAGLVAELATGLAADGWTYLRVNDNALPPAALGMTDPERRQVLVRAGLDEAQEAKTLAHERGHPLLHTSAPGAQCQRALQEVEAEWVAFMVCDAAGLDTSDYTVPYIAGWGSWTDEAGIRQAIAGAADRSRTAAGRILDGFQTLPVYGDGLPPELHQHIGPTPDPTLEPPEPDPPTLRL